MSRKGVGRGQKYTTRVHKGGKQSYARRGCLDMVLIGLGAGLAVLSLTGLAVIQVYSAL